MPSIWTCGCTFKSSQNTGIHLLLILSRKQGWRKTQKKPNSRWRTHLSKSEVRPVADCIRELSCDSLKSYTTRMILNGKISKEKSSHDKIHTVCRCLGSGCCCTGRPDDLMAGEFLQNHTDPPPSLLTRGCLCIAS